MYQKLFLGHFSPLINLFTITITSFLLLRKAISIDDPQFLACNTKTCGDGLNIKFPFYIENKQENYCGYPGFNVSCRNGRTVLRLQGRNYIIHQISYETKTIRVSNTLAFNACVPPSRNSSLWRNENFKLYSNQTELILMYNCNSSEIGGANNSELMKYKVNCSSDYNPTFSMFKDDPLLGRASGVCENATVAEVDVDRGGGEYQIQSSTEIQLMLERGFLLNWISSNCSVCQNSGGKCGFDFDSVHFRCFCQIGLMLGTVFMLIISFFPTIIYLFSNFLSNESFIAFYVSAEENKRLLTRVSIGLSSVFATIVVASLGCYYCFARKRGMKPENKVVEAFILHHHSLMPRRFSYSV